MKVKLSEGRSSSHFPKAVVEKPRVKTPAYDLVSRVAPKISEAEYQKIQAILHSQTIPTKPRRIRKSTAGTPYTLSVMPEGVVYIHLGYRGKLLGEGSFKKVYECVRLEGDAITKRAEVRICAEGESEARAALDEDWLANEFDSPHIVDISEDLIIYAGKKFEHKLRFIQPLMADGYQFIDEKHSFDERLKMIEGAARGLKCMHDKGYLHRDVKPHNIFIDDKGCTKLADLGLAIFYNDKVLPGGTLEFLPIAWDPDGSCFLTEKQTFKTDIYSLGITIEEIMNGQRSSDIAKLIIYMTHYDPKKRPEIGQVINVIETLRNGEKPDWKIISAG